MNATMIVFYPHTSLHTAHVFVTVKRMTRNDRGVIKTSSPESETQMAVKVGNNMLAEVHVLQCDCQHRQGSEQEE